MQNCFLFYFRMRFIKRRAVDFFRFYSRTFIVVLTHLMLMISDTTAVYFAQVI